MEGFFPELVLLCTQVLLEQDSMELESLPSHGSSLAGMGHCPLDSIHPFACSPCYRPVHHESVAVALGGRAGDCFFCNKVVVLIT